MRRPARNSANTLPATVLGWAGSYLVGFFRLAGLIVAAIGLAGCGSTTALSASEYASIRAGDMAVVLLRIESRLDDQPYRPFPSSAIERIRFGLGSFESGGAPEDVTTLRFLSPESRSGGWTYLLLRPGTYYLSVYPPSAGLDMETNQRIVEHACRWRIDIPEGSRLVYAGTLHLAGEGGVTSLPLLPKVKYMRAIRTIELDIDKDREAAAKLLTDSFRDMGEMQVIPMLRHKGPLILRAQPPASAK